MSEKIDNPADGMVALHRHLTDFDYMTNGEPAETDADHERLQQDAEAFAELLIESLDVTGVAVVGGSLRIDINPKSADELSQFIINKLGEPEVSENLD